MKKQLVSLVVLLLTVRVHSYGYYRTSSNPAVGNYGIQRQPVVVQNQSTGLSSVLPQNNAFVQTNPRQTTFRTTTTTTQVRVPQTTAPVSTYHTHPTQIPQPVPAVSGYAHSHGPQYAPPPQPAPGFPHAHSGHPYIAPAVAPQRMTYQQIIEYLTNTNGLNISMMLSNGSGNTLVQCKAYCDTLPPSPVCDTSNVLYRNECEAKCVNKTVSTENLRYGICCCSDTDYNYETNTNRFYSTTATINFCVSTCILNCLGGASPIATQHSAAPSMVIAQSTTTCANLT